VSADSPAEIELTTVLMGATNAGETHRILAAFKAEHRAEVLREAAEALRVEHRRIFWATKPDTCAEAEFLDRMANAGQAGKDTASSGESTQPADFFQPGHGYTHRSYGNDFHCVTVTTHPTTGERLAMGWLSEHGEWHRPHVVGINQWNHEYDGAEPPTEGGDAR
jgi:hypothetical protein